MPSKFQTFSADRLAVTDAPKAEYQKASGDIGETQWQMLKRLELPEMAWAGLREYGSAQGVRFLSAPFDEESADFLATLGVDALKIPSGELTNLAFLRHVAAFGQPLIVSTGMADLAETDRAGRRHPRGGQPAAGPTPLRQCLSGAGRGLQSAQPGNAQDPIQYPHRLVGPYPRQRGRTRRRRFGRLYRREAFHPRPHPPRPRPCGLS